MKKTKTISFGQVKAYARVADRLQEFRTANPRALIETLPTVQADGQVLFKARILADKGESNSAEATGHALGTTGAKAKDFEKLETIAVGRALALLGYASDGEIVSSEEMEEFEAHQKEKKETLIMEMRERLEEAKTLEELKLSWSSIPVEVKNELESLKEELKKKLPAEVQEVQTGEVPAPVTPEKPKRKKKDEPNTLGV